MHQPGKWKNNKKCHALEALSNAKVNKFKVAEAIQNSTKEPETLAELDELWKEQEAIGGESSECGTWETRATLTH
jgi:nitrate reductase delta subunit